MNRGEGLRIAARAKNGSVGLFQEEKKTKKKFSYKSRTQAFPVRKVQTTTDDKDLSKQGTSKSSHQGRDSSGKRLDNKPRDVTKEKPASANRSKETLKGTGRTSGNKESSGNKKRPVDFIKKNKAVGGTSSGIGGANTIALTEEQLNSILQSIGATHGVSSTPTISIENGQVKVQSDTKVKEDNQKSEKDEETGGERGKTEEKKDEETKKKNDENDDGKTVASENVLELLEKLNRETDENANKAQTEISSKPPSLPKTPDTSVGKIEDDMYKRSNLTDLKEKVDNKWGSSVGMGNIGAVVGVQRQGQLTLQERKKLEWKKALDEQLAEKKRLQEMESKLHRSLDGTNLESYQRKESPHQVTSNISREPDLPKERPKKDPTDDVILKSSLGEVAQQSYIPSAMRSSFFIGGSAGQRADDYNAELKRKEQQEWIQELEKQRREAAEKKERQRRKQREEELIMEHWADPVEHKSSTREPEIPSSNQGKEESNIHSVSSLKKEGASSFNSSQTTDILSPRQNGEMSFTRSGVNSLVDPAELERREHARKKHLEHMRAVQQQVEEKQRLKREADERRRKEEAEEERRLAKEREDLQRQFDQENEKQKQKEREAAAKQKALEDSIFNAQQEALAAKHAKRIERLTQHGHDATNLRKSWELKHSTDYSPRQVVHSSQQHSSPPVENLETHTVPQEPRNERLNFEETPGTRDVGTFTVNEQSTQTGLDFFNHEALSPRLLEAIRQASAGIEYKARDQTSQREGKNLNKEKYSEREEKVSRRRTDQSEKNENVEKPRQKKKQEKPKWGQNTTKKKISNSEKDLSHTSKGREERRRKRQEELLAQQERLTRRRDSLRKTSRQEVDEDSRSEVSANERMSRGQSNISREQSKVDNRKGGHDEGKLGATEVISRGSPELTDGDFYPFLRSEDVKLNNRSVNVTPVREGTFEKERTYIDTNTYQTSNTYQSPVELDPLLNPERLKDSGQRQEKILEQLSHLRQGLMMKQREIELGLSPAMMM
ncbi:Coiled-coil domain-containing protein 66 [Holothuria leucospilota]|uniref:Coiled-coil domain-containing protein 66 n=1 Tax=Holothuria leucospilota TaxID=206669 RepID=A0A9Q1HHW0_HOLLE|nr:Coiled-coil domain-containing protein 66 [Holothuria leucospilota]